MTDAERARIRAAARALAEQGAALTEQQRTALTALLAPAAAVLVTKEHQRRGGRGHVA